MVDEKKEILFQQLQKEIKDLIFLSKRRNIITEAKDLIHGDVCLSLRDVIILYQAYLKDCFKDFHKEKENLEQKLSKDLSYPVRLVLSLIHDEWRDCVKTPDNMKKYWHLWEFNNCCKETVSMQIFFNHQQQALLEEVYWNHVHGPYLKNEDLSCFMQIYPKYKKELKSLMQQYYKQASALTSFEKIWASDTEKSNVEISFYPFYRYEEKFPSIDSEDIRGKWSHTLLYYSEEYPINLSINKVEDFRLKPWYHYGNFFVSLDLDYNLQDALFYEDINSKIVSLVSKDSDGRLLPEIEFLISEAFPNFKIYLKDLPDFFSDYLEKYRKTDYLIEGKKKFDRQKEKERIKELQVVDNTKQLLANNNLKIVKLVKKNQKLYEKLGNRQPVTKEILCKMIEDEESGHWIIRPEFINDLEYYDLSGISFDNVDVKEVNFKNTNIKSINFDPQRVYHKDLSGCYFETSISSPNGVIFDYSTDFTGVNLSGTIIRQPLTFYNSSIVDAEINQHTVLPEELWQMRKTGAAKKNIKS